MNVLLQSLQNNLKGVYFTEGQGTVKKKGTVRVQKCCSTFPVTAVPKGRAVLLVNIGVSNQSGLVDF